MKVALLLRPTIEVFDTQCCAGTERAFLLHLDFLKKKKIKFSAFSAAKIINGQRYNITRLFFFSWLAKLGQKIITFSSSLPFFWKIGNYLYVLATLPYCLAFILRSRNSDILFTFNVPLMALLYPRKTIVRIGLPADSFFLPFQKKCSHRYEQAFFCFVSKDLGRNFLKTHPYLSLNYSYIVYNGVDTEIFSPKKKTVLPNKGRELRFLYVSYWGRAKGIFLLLKAAQALEKKGLKFKLFLSGSADLWSNPWAREEAEKIRRKIHSVVRNLKNVVIVGIKNYRDLPSLYSSVDFLVFPSIWKEPFSNAVLEAMACGTPVIAFKRGGTSEVIEDNKSGYLLNKVTIKELEDILGHLIKNETPGHIKQMGMAARRRVKEMFSLKLWEREISKLLKQRIYKSHR